jgi:hypothetical protein
MKKIVGILIFAFAVVTLNAQNEQHVYGIKSGYVEYELTGSTIGTKKIWWDNYGEQTRTEINSTSTTKMFGIENEVVDNSIIIVNGDKYWTINLDDETGMTGKINKSDASITEGMTEAEREEYINGVMEAFGGKIIGKETINGIDCEIFEVFGSKSWMYEGICLKSDVSLMGIENYEISTKLEKDITINASQFIAPENIEYTDKDAIQKNMYNEMYEDYEDDE